MMKAMMLRALALGSALALGACASQVPETRVTRFHLGQPQAPGQVVIEPRDPGMAGDLEFRSYADAVGRELTRLGYTMAPGLARSELVAVVDVMRGTREALAQQSPVSVGLGGGSFGRGLGVGGGINFPIGRGRGRYLTATQLSVQIKRRSEGTVIWEGRAETEARDGAAGSSPQEVVSRLAADLFRDFPGESGRTIRVR